MIVVQCQQRGIPASADSRSADGHRDFVHAIDRPVDAVVTDFQQGEGLLIPVQPGFHLLHAGLPVGVLPPQDRRFREVFPQNRRINPHIQRENDRPGSEDDQRLKQPVLVLFLFQTQGLGVEDVFFGGLSQSIQIYGIFRNHCSPAPLCAHSVPTGIIPKE